VETLLIRLGINILKGELAALPAVSIAYWLRFCYWVFYVFKPSYVEMIIH